MHYFEHTERAISLIHDLDRRNVNKRIKCFIKYRASRDYEGFIEELNLKLNNGRFSEKYRLMERKRFDYIILDSRNHYMFINHYFPGNEKFNIESSIYNIVFSMSVDRKGI